MSKNTTRVVTRAGDGTLRIKDYPSPPRAAGTAHADRDRRLQHGSGPAGCRCFAV